MDERILVEWILKKERRRMTELFWLGMETYGGLF
jgi:hypothetical protein